MSVESSDSEPVLNLLFFSPNSAIWRHLSAEIQVSMELIADNHEVTFLNCEKNFSEICVAMSAYGITFDSPKNQKNEICKRCLKSSDYLSHIPFFKVNQIPDLSVYQCKVNDLTSEVNSSNWHELVIDGMPIGKMAAYEFLLNNKIPSLQIPLEVFPAYLSSLRYSIAIMFFAQDFLGNHRYDAIVVYNRHYSLNNIFCKVAEKMGLATYSLQAAGSLDALYSKFTFFKNDLDALKINSSPSWEKMKSVSLTRKDAKSVVGHFRALSQATSPWVYSSEFRSVSRIELRDKLKIPEQSKVLLLTTSSADEMFALKLIGLDPARLYITPIFESQHEWIRSVCEYVSKNEDLFLIVRIHPREFANKREPTNSQNGKGLIDMLNEFNSENIYINLPADGVSLYDYARIADLLLTGNSSAGAELAMLGLPVICHEQRNLTAFPMELAFWASSRADYFNLIQSKIGSRENGLARVNALRWFNFKFSYLARPTKLSKFGYLFLVESVFRRPIIKYDWRIPSLLVKTFYSLLMTLLNGRTESTFGAVLTRNFSGLHMVSRRLPNKNKWSSNHESEAISKINQIFKIDKD